MPNYYADKQPDLSRFRQNTGASGSMQATIVLDKTHSAPSATYTNCDTISGRVVVQTSTRVNVSSIVVKLEGESRTRLLPPPSPQDEFPKPQLEFHKILYKVQLVFPATEVVDERLAIMAGNNKQYTLLPGRHEYPFSFNIPFNNACALEKNSSPAVHFAGLSMEVAKAPTRHVKRLLPPTLPEFVFPREAEIRYYVKVTVTRPNWLKENVRAILPFNFCPIEPPRPENTGAEVFARRRHQFTTVASLDPKKSIFPTREKSTAPSELQEAPFIGVEMRLPDPGIITCGRPIPLRLLITSLNDATDNLEIVSLRLSFITYTLVKAHGLQRTENSGTITAHIAQHPYSVRFSNGSKEAVIDSNYWNGQTIEFSLSPSFETCNISQTHDFVMEIEIGYTPLGSPPQYAPIELRLPVRVFSGILPPAGVQERMANASGVSGPPLPPRTKQEPKSQDPDLRAAPPPPPPDASHEYTDAPPSYEDAITEKPPMNEETSGSQSAPPTDGEHRPLYGDGDEKSVPLRY